MKSRQLLFTFFALVCLCALMISRASAQAPGVIYTWAGTGDTRGWVQNFGANAGLLSNTIPGELTIIETGPDVTTTEMSISDGANRVIEASTASGGYDLTGLSSLQFDLGHNGGGPLNVQFYVQASTGFTFEALGPDLAVAPGINTYTVPLTGLTSNELVYIRTIGFTARQHSNPPVVWTLQEVRSAGTELFVRDLITHNAGTPEGGLQGSLVNFDNAAIQGNNGGQNQTGLSWNATGSGSLQWTDLGGSNGGAVSWGNGTALNGNTFNNRLTNASGYDTVIFTVSATDAQNGGGSVNAQAFFQTGPGFTFQSPGAQALPIDGAFHDLAFPLAGLLDMSVIDLTGLNLGGHTNTLTINVDNIRFTRVPEPATLTLFAIAIAGCGAIARRRR